MKEKCFTIGDDVYVVDEGKVVSTEIKSVGTRTFDREVYYIQYTLSEFLKNNKRMWFSVYETKELAEKNLEVSLRIEEAMKNTENPAQLLIDLLRKGIENIKYL